MYYSMLSEAFKDTKFVEKEEVSPITDIPGISTQDTLFSTEKENNIRENPLLSMLVKNPLVAKHLVKVSNGKVSKFKERLPNFIIFVLLMIIIFCK